MAEEVPDLVIPIRLDNAQALRDLNKLDQQGTASAADIAKGMGKAETAVKELGSEGEKTGDKIREGMQKGTEGAETFSSSLRTVLGTQLGLNALERAAGAIGESFKATARYVNDMAKGFQQLRASQQGVASLAGEAATNKFTGQQIDLAQRANVTPQEWTEFQKQYLAKASLYVGEGKEAKLSKEESEDFTLALSEYAKQKGVSQQEMSGFAGGLLAQEKGRTSAAEMKARAGKVFATLEASSADVAHLLPMMTRTMAQGFSAEEAAPTLAMMPEIAPEEEGTYVLRAVAQMREMVQKGQGEQFGLKKGQTPYQMLQAATTTLKSRAAKGEDLDEMLTKLAPEQISQSAIRGMVAQGPEGFARWRGLVEDTPSDEIARLIARGRGTEPGRQYAVDAREAAEKARVGLRNDELARRRQIAETELTAARRFERVDVGEAVASTALSGGGLFGEDLRGQQVNRQMIRRARGELGEQTSFADIAKSGNAGLTDDLMRDLLARLKARGVMSAAPAAEGGLAPAAIKSAGGPGEPAAAGAGEMHGEMKKQTALLEKMADALAKQREPVGKPSAALPGKPGPHPRGPS